MKKVFLLYVKITTVCTVAREHVWLQTPMSRSISRQVSVHQIDSIWHGHGQEKLILSPNFPDCYCVFVTIADTVITVVHVLLLANTLLCELRAGTWSMSKWSNIYHLSLLIKLEEKKKKTESSIYTYP